jgi:hypothetical protein
MKEPTTVLVPLPVETAFRIARQLGQASNWLEARADAETHTMVWKLDHGRSVSAKLEPKEDGTVLTLIAKTGTFDRFKSASLLETFAVQFRKRSTGYLFAILGLERPFAEAGQPKWVVREDVERVARKFHMDLDNELRAQLALLYEKYLTIFAGDGQLSDDDLHTLSHLRNIFRLDAETVDQIHLNANSRDFS